MDHRSGQKRAVEFLYPPIDPFDQRVIDMGDGHRIYVEQCGNPQGIPVVVLHGGPGGGCSPAMRRYFDPAVYRVILFDQRGCGRSRPHASVIQNTTWHLVADIEVIRQTLGIDRWMVFGGSWGATLALVYAITHPERATNLVLRGVFLMTRKELDWFYGGGAGQFFPELWARFANAIPSDERDDLIAAYHRRLFSGNVMEETKFGRIWANWENALASIQNDGMMGESPGEYVLSEVPDKTYSRGVMSTRMSFHSSVGIYDKRRSISASPVETIWMTAAWPAARSASMLEISVGVFIEVSR